MTFLKRNHLWPLFDRYNIAMPGRWAWVLWRWWFWPWQWQRARDRCQEHADFYATYLGTIREFEAGLPGRRQVRCGRCAVVVWEEP